MAGHCNDCDPGGIGDLRAGRADPDVGFTALTRFDPDRRSDPEGIGIAAIFVALSSPTNSMLQAVGKVNVPVKLTLLGDF